MKEPLSLFEVIGKIVENDLRYHEKAYLFILSALNRTIDALPEPRHITGRELSEGCRDLALEEYGPFARDVLEYWGVRTTEDFGELIFNLLEWGILTKTREDSKEDFVDVFDFSEAFQTELLGERDPREKEEEE